MSKKWFIVDIAQMAYTIHMTNLELGQTAVLSKVSPSQDSMVMSLLISFSRPSQNTPPSLVSATLVNTVLDWMVSIMVIGLVLMEVPVEWKGRGDTG